jgi:hypothetical protein
MLPFIFIEDKAGTRNNVSLQKYISLNQKLAKQKGSVKTIIIDLYLTLSAT